MNKNYALVLARKNSKRLPGKNSKILGDKPLIVHTFQHISKSMSSFDGVIVSSDCNYCLDLARSFEFATVERSPEDSDDNVSSAISALTAAKKVSISASSWITLFQPTNPFRTRLEIEYLANLVTNNQVHSIATYEQVDLGHPNRVRTIDKNGVAMGYIDLLEDIPRSDLPVVYKRNGNLYATKVSFLEADKSFVSGRHYGIVSPQKTSIAIDYLEDFVMAEGFYSYFGERYFDHF